MDATAHGSFSFWLYTLVYYLIWNEFPPLSFIPFMLLLGVIPDLDVLYARSQGKKYKSNNFQHHMCFWSHWPISYSPFILISILTLIFNFYPKYFLLPTICIYSHFIADSACCGDGMMWGKLPMLPKQFAPFINLFSSKTDGYHGNYWEVRWRKTKMSFIALFSSILIIFFIFYRIFTEHETYEINDLIAAIIGLIIISIFIMSRFRKINDRYKNEPVKGRYDDYRKNIDYLNWMEENGYEFNDKMFAKKVKKSK